MRVRTPIKNKSIPLNTTWIMYSKKNCKIINRSTIWFSFNITCMICLFCPFTNMSFMSTCLLMTVLVNEQIQCTWLSLETTNEITTTIMEVIYIPLLHIMQLVNGKLISVKGFWHALTLEWRNPTSLDFQEWDTVSDS